MRISRESDIESSGPSLEGARVINSERRVLIHRSPGCMDAQPWVFWVSTDGHSDGSKEVVHR